MVSQDRKTGVSTIIRVFEGSPAEKAGIRPGDIIFAVGDTEVTGMDLTIMVNNYIKGEEDTNVEITVYREDTGEYVDLTVTRKPVDVQTVTGKMPVSYTHLDVYKRQSMYRTEWNPQWLNSMLPISLSRLPMMLSRFSAAAAI